MSTIEYFETGGGLCKRDIHESDGLIGLVWYGLYQDGSRDMGLMDGMIYVTSSIVRAYMNTFC